MAIRPIARKPATARRLTGIMDPNAERAPATRNPATLNALGKPLQAAQRGGPAAAAPGGPGGVKSTSGTGTQYNMGRPIVNNSAPSGGGAGAVPTGSTGVAPIGSNTGPTAPQAGVGVGPQGSQLQNVGDPYTGFASQYVPGRSDDIFSNPGTVLQDVLRGMGVSNPTQSGYYMELEPLADIVNELMLLQNPNTLGSQESAINYMGSFFNNAATPGGRGPSFANMRGNLEGADPMGPLGVFLGMSGGVDQRDQISQFLKLGRAAATGGLHPYYADAFNNLMAVAANDYMNAGVKGETANFVDYWNQNYGNYMR